MLSATEIELWNRKLHTYVGLYLLFFIWLFFFTGLLLNHPQWSFAEFWPNRKQSRQEYQIQPPSGGNDLTQARALMRQLGMVGEVEWTTTRADQNRFEFRISRPGHVCDVKADFRAGRATVERIDMNEWGVVRILHTFTGVRMADRRNQRDWIFTEVWACGDGRARWRVALHGSEQSLYVVPAQDEASVGYALSGNWSRRLRPLRDRPEARDVGDRRARALCLRVALNLAGHALELVIRVVYETLERGALTNVQSTDDSWRTSPRGRRPGGPGAR